MGRQVRKHEGSHGKVDAPPPKKPRSTERPLAPLAAATTTAKPRRDVVRPAARKSSASSDRGPVAPGSDLETEGYRPLTPSPPFASMYADSSLFFFNVWLLYKDRAATLLILWCSWYDVVNLDRQQEKEISD